MLWVLFALGALPILLYSLNPYGTSTWDPRARILGITTYRISSGSMEPTLAQGDLVLVQASAYTFDEPEIGEVIVFRYPEDKSVPFVFRVVGKGGDRVRIVEGSAIVNDISLDEDYVQLPVTYPYSQSMEELAVGEKELFVLGDNRDIARDGRFWGTVPRDHVIGKVFYIWYSDDANRIGSVQ